MKKQVIVSLALALMAFPFGVMAQNDDLGDAPQPPQNGRGFGEMRQRGGRGGFGGGPGMMGRGPGMAGGVRMPMMESARLKAEDEIKQKFPDEFAALEKERAALEQKFQALAGKSEVKLPKTYEDRILQYKEFQKTHEKELKEIEELGKTDRRAAFEKMIELYKSAGIEFPGMGMRFNGPGMMPPGDMAPAKAAPRGQKVDINEVKKLYPEEYKKISALKNTDKEEYRKQLRALFEKYEAEKKNQKKEQPSE